MIKTHRKPSPKPKSKRQYGAIGTDEIITAAIAILNREGLAGLSMRSLATELNLSPMAAYYYVPNKEALIDLVVDRIYSGLSYSDTSGSPEQRLRQLFWDSLRLMRKYPGLALFAAKGREGKELARIRNEAKDLFIAAGFSARYTEAGIMLFALFHYGAVILETSIGKGIRLDGMVEELEQELDEGLSVILAGLKSLGDAEKSRSQPKKPNIIGAENRSGPRRRSRAAES